MKRLLISLLLVFLFGDTYAQMDTIRSIHNGYWNDSNIWSPHRVPNNDTIYVIVNNIVLLDTNVIIDLPGSIYVTRNGSICGPYFMECQFTSYGPISIDSMYLHGISYSHAMVTSLYDITVFGAGSDWQASGGVCVGCSFTCASLPTQKPKAGFVYSSPVCSNSQITFNDTSTNADSWQWYFQNGNPSSSTLKDTIVTYSAPGMDTVTLIVSNALGSDTITKVIHVNGAPPTPSVCCNTTITYGNTVSLSASGDATYQWFPSATLSCDTCANVTAFPLKTTTYYVSAVTDSGCRSTQWVTINVECGDVFVPNAFSPNGDGQNDVLFAYGPCIKSMDFMVFDRWGNMMFETENINEGWDGRYHGLPMNSGTYAYVLNTVMVDDSVIQKKGSVELLR
jgi:gliding motility-associated-like protein